MSGSQAVGPADGRSGAPLAKIGDWPTWHCPRHDTDLELVGSALGCPMSHSYPIVGGIARFVGDQAYAEAFGLQWLRYRKTQLDSHTGTTISRDRVSAALGPALWTGLPDAHVLEAGCGAGRFTEVLLDQGAWVTAVDLSEAVVANRENFGDRVRYRVAQASILDLPFRAGAFDLVLCLGVVQHTPDPEETIRALFRFVRPGGWLVFDHYTFSVSRLTKTAPLFRAVFKRLPPETGLRWTERLVRALYPVHRALRHMPLAQRFLSRLSPVQTYFRAYPDLTEELQYEWALLDTHDGLTDRHKHLRTPGRIASVLDSLEAVDVVVRRGGNGVEARARRPEPASPTERP